MRERWKELIEQAINEIGPEDNPSKEETLKRYAELIINDCVDACLVASGTRWMRPPTQDQIVLDCVREIRLRFGIET